MILTATEIEKRRAEFWGNPSPELQAVYDKWGEIQEKVFAPLIARAEELLKSKQQAERP